MRVALGAVGSVGLRAGRVLLSDRRITELGSLSREVRSSDPRVRAIDSADGFDLLVSNAALDEQRVRDAVAAGVPLVTPHPFAQVARVAGKAPFMAACAPDSGLPAALASLALEQLDRVVDVTAAVTAAPRRIRSRRSACFPDPVGTLWCERVPQPVAHPTAMTFLHAPFDGPLSGISVTAYGEVDGRPRTVAIGIVDDPDYLAAIALAGAALMVVDQGSGLIEQLEVSERAGSYVAACTRAGMGTAAFIPAS